MAYFRCSLGGGSGNGAVITVTYGAEFYNQTLVATNGTDTVSVLASSSGTADITVPSEGSWVISCTIGADTYTSDPVLVELSYEATITAIPDGSTVLPTDDIQTWLECAGITDKAYTTLAEVLADTDTYTTLLGDSNACDYMARSTTWASTIVADADAMRLLGMYDYACDALLSDSTWASAICNSTYFESVLNVSVPKMTSATTPSGQVFASSENSANSYNAWKAFDGSDSTFWGTNDSSSTFTNIYVGYTFTEATVIASYYVKFNTSVTACTYKLQGSNDGTNWTDIGSTNTTLDGYTYVTNDTAYTSYRLFIVSETLDSAKLGGRVLTLQFYGRHTAQTDIIVSAPSDTIYYMDNGSPVTLCTTDANGIGEVDWSTLPTGDITLYSSVAKNPTDLTADYSKSIKVTKNKVEGYLMPEISGLLYWWGWESDDLQDCTTANGWSRTSHTLNAPTRNTNSITCASSAANTVCMVSPKSKSAIGGKMNVVWEGVYQYNSAYGYIIEYSSKAMGSATYYETLSTSALQITSHTNVTESYQCVGVNAQASTPRQCTVYALWLEQEVNNGNYTRVRVKA